MNLNSVHWKEMFVSRQTKENIRLRRFSSSILGSVQRTVLDEFYTDKLAGYHTTLFLSGTTLPTTSLPHRVMHRRWTLKFFHVSFIYWNWLLSREAFSLVWAHFLVVFGNERVEINLKRLNPTHKLWVITQLQLKKGCMFSFPAGCVGISLSFQEDPVNYCQQIYIFFILATLSTSKNHLRTYTYTELHEIWLFCKIPFKWLHLEAFVQKPTHHTIIL